ncbi:MAG: nitronate monooxygenase [Burkholderiales bacterium]|nr:nitronate monooxygenase [Burkholderiales bacterium]
MRTPICERLGCEVPIFAFTHCRDVVVEVTKAGGYGVLGALTYSPEQFEIELRWIDEHVGGRPYGVDIVIPNKYDKEAAKAPGPLKELIPEKQRAFVREMLDAAGIPPLPPGEDERIYQDYMARERNYTPEGATRFIEVTLRHDKVNLVVSALGAPPGDAVEEFHRRGILVGGMCGSPAHTRHQRQAGVDLLIAQGTEAGGHTGTISTLVLVPMVVEAAGGIPVLAAGGISRGSQIAAALALGAQGVWCGTVWLGTRESELTPMEKRVLFRARTEDAVIRRWMSGKTVRMIRSKASEAWEQPGAPAPLMAPLQSILFNQAKARIERAQRDEYCSFPAGQVAGTMSGETTVREIMYALQNEYLSAMERLVAFGK